jgi:hypothetical protein
MRTIAIILLFSCLLILGFGLVSVSRLKTEIEPPPAELTPAAVSEAQAAQAPTEEVDQANDSGSQASDEASRADNGEKPLRHGLTYALLLPVLIIGVPWVLLELLIIRYVQPRGIDLTEVRIKAQDGLFIQTVVSMTARRSLTLASTRMTWGRVQDLVEKTIEQELLHEAIQFPTLDDLERGLKEITERFLDLPIVRELSLDFGVEVMRFNVETRYPQETMDALNRKAEASAGGTAYLAYAAAAHLDPDTPECRDLYKIYQETSGQVDAARNLGGGITSLANLLGQRGQVKGEDGGISND